ncbi:hypothetical protein HBB16_13825, partial [Pseudonocardia sp. MCCB 268]|nr:hypothetical protein [Pseudonocardia cytotoxica]
QYASFSYVLELNRRLQTESTAPRSWACRPRSSGSPPGCSSSDTCCSGAQQPAVAPLRCPPVDRADPGELGCRGDGHGVHTERRGTDRACVSCWV